MIYLILIFQLLILILLFYLLTKLNKDKKSVNINNIDKEELIEWQNIVVEILQEAENIAKELGKTLDGKSKEIDEKIKKLDKKLKIAENIINNVDNVINNKTKQKVVTKPQWEIIPHNDKLTQLEEKSKLPKEYDKIYQLADEGLNVADIAKKTNIGKGEIQLILDLRKKITLQ